MAGMCGHRLNAMRASRAEILLALFALVWLQLVTADHRGPAAGAAATVGDSTSIEALIASAWCGTSGAPTSNDQGSGHAASTCLHCATGCHASADRAIAWWWMSSLADPSIGSTRMQHNAAAPDWASANRTRGPPQRSIGV